MNISITTPSEPCPYVSLQNYSWAIRPIFLKPRGQCHGLSLDWNFTVISLFVAFHAIGVWMALAITIEAMVTFKRWSTVYFWSIITTACAIVLYTLTVDIMFLTNSGNMDVLGDIIYPIAVVFTYEGFLMVLYSRLHLIIDSPKILRALLFVILGVGIPLQIVIALAGDRILSTNVWVVTFRLEMIFPFSEILLSSLYVFLFIRFMRQSAGAADPHMRRTFYFLVVAEAFVVIMDLVGITLWYMDLYLLRLAVLPLTTALKLKVEFLILNRLTSIGKKKNELRSITVSAHDEEMENSELQMASPCTFQSEALTLKVEEKGLGTDIDMREDRRKGKKTPTDSIREVGTSAASGDGAESESLDEMERRYLGKFDGSNMV
ncbi:hypothetical protein Vi05172_g1813 [Venturia inaequalis]|nr:hypothetical protein Vi05172_g1813 [Venturia inaequalis]